MTHRQACREMVEWLRDEARSFREAAAEFPAGSVMQKRYDGHAEPFETRADALSALLAESEWKLIDENTPKDRPVDMWATVSHNTDDGFKRFPAARWRDRLGWTSHDGSTNIRPTHFRELPVPPPTGDDGATK